jgi:osmotically-inducible protein OsmY
MPNQNGRNMNDNRGEQRSWRPQDDERMMRDRGERDQRDRDDDTERFGGGQSGYGSGRFGDDRSMGAGYRNQSQPQRGNYDDRQGMHTDDRFSGRGGEGYWEDRSERTNYNSGYNQGGMGYGNYGGGQQQRGSQQGFRGGNAGANMASEYNQGRYPDMYGPDDNYGSYAGRQNGRFGQGGNYQQADFEHGVGYGQGTGGRWANVPQAGMQQDYGRGMPQSRGMQGGYGMQGGGYGGMQGNYGSDMQRGYGGYGGSGMQGGYGQQQSHRGKGPQGYTRSDDRIKETVCEALHDDDHVDASHIEVVVKNGEVMLTGNVDDRRQKRLAEDLVERLPGVKDVQNQLRCGSSDRRGNQNTGSAVGKNETEMSSDKKHRA